MGDRHPGTGSGGFWRQKRWWVAVMLLAVTTISYIDRLALSVAAPVLKGEFGFSNEQYGRITLAFLLMYGMGQLLLGPFIDRLGSKRSLTLAVVWWSVASILHALGRGVWSFFGARAFLGITESVNFPGGTTMRNGARSGPNRPLVNCCVRVAFSCRRGELGDRPRGQDAPQGERRRGRGVPGHDPAQCSRL